MTENQLRHQVTAQAESWLGVREGEALHREILAIYNAHRPAGGYVMGPEDPWCAAFVSAVGAACGLEDILYPDCSCPSMLAKYRAAGRFEEADEAVPRPGDLIFYDWQDSGQGDCRGEPDHVGLILEANERELLVIEGNLSDRVGTRRIKADSRYLRGFGKPDYLGRSEYQVQGGLPEPAAKTEAPSAPRFAALELPTLAQGERGESVRAAQLLLIGRGCRCGPWGADGDFGPATRGGVLRFQRGRNLECDGVIGPLTWRALLGL